MTEQRTLPPRSDTDFTSPSPAYDPVAQARLFEGVIGKRFVAFLIDAVIISLLWLIAVFVVGVLGIVTLGLAWLLFGAVVPVRPAKAMLHDIFAGVVAMNRR